MGMVNLITFEIDLERLKRALSHRERLAAFCVSSHVMSRAFSYQLMNRCAWGITTLGSQTDESKRCSEVVQGTKLRVYWHMTQTYRRVRPKS